MRVLFPFPRQFGYFPDIYEYVVALRKRGIDTHYAGVQHGSHEVENPPYATHLAEGQDRKAFLRFVREQVDAIQPDIVHVFHFRGCGLLPLVARSTGRKWIVDVRTIHVETRNATIKSDFWLRDRLTWMETQTYDYILALTDTIRRRLQPSVRPIQIVPLGASSSRLSPADRDHTRARIRNELGIAADAPVILYAGSLSPTRRLDQIVDGFSRVLALSPTAILLLVGGELGQAADTDPSIAILRAQVQKLDIVSNVVFTGRVPYWDVPAFFAAADVGVSFMPLGTPHQYQPPTKLIEYMMAGIPSASNDIPAIKGLIEDGVQGILFGDSPEEIAAGLQRALTLLQPGQEESYTRLIANASEAVRTREWQYLVDHHLIPLYERLHGR